MRRTVAPRHWMAVPRSAGAVSSRWAAEPWRGSEKVWTRTEVAPGRSVRRRVGLPSGDRKGGLGVASHPPYILGTGGFHEHHATNQSEYGHVPASSCG